MGNLYPPPPPPKKIGDGKMARFGFCTASSLIYMLGGKGFAVPVILSKIIGTSETKSHNNVDETFSMVFSFVCFLGINCI